NDNTAPTTPVISVEPAFTVGNSNTVSWSASSDGVGSGGIQYRVETDTSAAFTSPDFSSGWQTSRSYTFSSLVDGTTYHYRVKARDALGQEGSWSAIQSSEQDGSPPPVPGIATEPVYTPGTTNTIEWTEVTDAGIGGERYQVQIDDAPSFATPLANSGWTTLTSYTFSGLTDGTKYYYRVHSRDAFVQISDWSGTTSSTQDASAPPAPTMKQANWYNSGLYFVAEWTAVTDTGVGGVEYYCEYDDLPNFASPNGNSGWTTAMEYNFTGLQENRWYYYHVRARDALGQQSAWSAYIFARQDNTPPTVPTMTAEPAWTAGTTNTVSWSASADTGGIWQITYQVEIDTDTSFNPPLQTSPWITARSYTFTGLQDGMTYYYHVRARDGLLQESTWSSMVASTQDASPPPAPTMASEPEFTQGTSNIVSWTTVTDNSGGTVQYRVYASLSSVFATTEGDSGWRTTATWTFSGLTDGSTYYYRVKARDQFAQEGAWSNIVHSTQDGTAPTGYYMITEPTYTQGITNTVEWNPATDSGSGGVEYQCEVWTI
ncbi:MAG: fibronectin type III domain-containing protein, partial [Thermoplasmata archaeon]|nr:fibronectin type III domain-containing protein [Thermoplasmata archaeon]